MFLRYGLAEYHTGKIIHAVVGGYSYRAEVLEVLENELVVFLLMTGETHTVPKQYTFT